MDLRPKDDGSTRTPWHWGNLKKHFLSETHCKQVASSLNTTDTLQNVVAQHSEESVTRDTLVPAIVDDTIVEMCSRSLPHTASAASLNCTARALLAVAGSPGRVSSADIIKARKHVSNEVGDILTRLNAVTAKEQRGTKFDSKQMCVLRRGRRAVSQQIMKLAAKTLASKGAFLTKCKQLGLSADESDTFSGSAPLAAALQGCSPDFEWFNAFIGQVDVASKKDGNRRGCTIHVKTSSHGLLVYGYPGYSYMCSYANTRI